MTTKKRIITWQAIFDNPCAYCDHVDYPPESVSSCDYCKYGSRSTEIKFKLGKRYRIRGTEPEQILKTKPKVQKTKFRFLIEE